MSRLIEEFIPPIKEDGIVTAKAITTTSTVTAAGVTTSGVFRSSTSTAITASATPAINAALGNVFTLTPGEDETISITGMTAGQPIYLIILTSGSSSRTLTFGTGFKTTGTLATGTSSGKYFIMSFISDGTNVYEVSRTTAI